MRTCGVTLTRNALLDQAASYAANRSSLQTALERAGYMHAGANIMQSTDADILLTGLRDRCSTFKTMREYGLSQTPQSYTLILAAPRIAPGQNLTNDSAQLILTHTNAARSKGQNCGGTWYPPAPTVQWNPSLAQAARDFAQWQASRNLTGHVDPTLGNPGDRAARAGWHGSWGENLAYGPGNPEEAVKSWIQSPSHCRNLMNPKHTVMGAGVAINPHSTYGVYWGQLFGY